MNNNVHIQKEFYKLFIEPYLESSVRSGDLYYYLLDAGYQGWRMNISKDKNLIRPILRMYEDLFSKFPNEFIEIANLIFELNYDSKQRITSAEKMYYVNYRESKFDRVSALLGLYKSFFENELRLPLTPIYFYIEKVVGLGSKCKTISDFINLPSSEKRTQLLKCEDIVFGIKMEDLLTRFNNKIRNSGAGHDNWRIDDNDNIEFKDTHPKTGKIKKLFKLSEDELREELKSCRRIIWLLEVCFMIFLNNNSFLFSQINPKKVYTKNEIEDNLKQKARESELDLTSFYFDRLNRIVEIELKHIPKMISGTQEVYLSNHIAFKLVTQKCVVKFKYQVLRVLQHLILFVDTKFQKINVKLLDNLGNDLMNISMAEEGIEKLSKPADYKILPPLLSGNYIEDEYAITYQVKENL